MRKRIAALLILILMITSIIIPFTFKDTSSIVRENTSGDIILLNESIPLADSPNGDICQSIAVEINKYRAANGLPSLTWSPELADAAAIRAQEVSVYWSHTRPNGQPWYTVNENIMYGENLAKGYSSPDSVVSAWKASPAHNENLLYTNFKYIAIVEYNGYFACEFT